jgi:hypothetical protein
MFESIQRPRRPRPRLLLLVSIAAHVGALALLVSTALWQIDKLEVADSPIMVAAGPGAPLSDGPEEAAAPEKPKPPKPRRTTHDVTQKDDRKAEPEEDGGGGDSQATGDGAGAGGDGLGIGQFSCGEGGACSSILDQPAAPTPPPRKVEEERVVVSRLIEGSRIEGNPRIEPPESVRQAMVRLAQKKVDGAVKMCLDRAGNVRSLRLMRSTGHGEYDQRLLSGMRTWRYRPYRLDSGAAVPVCTVVTFIYRVQ